MQDMTVGLARVAQAFGKNEEQFCDLIPALEALGFPTPNSSDDGIKVCDLIDWLVNQQEANLAIAALIAEAVEETRD